MVRFRSIVVLVMALVLCAQGAARSAEPELQAYDAIPAADGSVELVLDFDTFAPTAEVVHTLRNDVKVVVAGVERGKNLPGIIGQVGAIKSGKIAPFLNLGLVVDLHLLADVRVRVETEGTRIVVHIPAKNSDEESHLTAVTQTQAQGVEIIPLSFADVSEVAGLLKSTATVASVDNFTAQSPFAQPTPNPNSNGSSSSSQQTITSPTYVTLPTYALVPKDTPQGVYVNEHVSVDRRLNAIILRGTKEEIAPYERLIALVDTPRREVLLETKILELTENAAYALGFNFSPSGQLASGAITIGNQGTGGTGAPIPTSPETSNAPRTYANFSATLSALATNGQAKILAQPRILAADNRMAAILSGEAVPIFTNVLVPSGGTTILQQQLQYINVGVSLEILPRISANGIVTADVFSEVSSVLSYVQTAPEIAVRQELTAVSVADGQSVLIGGLLQDQEIRSYNKVPGLGDIPLIGELFKQATSTGQKTNLYVVITPHVLTKSAKTIPTPPPGN